MKNDYKDKIIVSVFVISLIISVFLPNSASATENKNNSKMCKMLYDAFKKHGETKFIEKYKKKSFLNDCLKLYKNPNWYFVGKNKIDKYYEQLKAIENTKQKQPQLDVLWKKFSGNGKYLLKYRLCTSDQHVLHSAVLVNSRSEKFLTVSYDPIQSNSCKTYQVEVKAFSANDISIKYIQNIKDPTLKGLKIINLEKNRT